jgi:hypothetical protein
VDAHFEPADRPDPHRGLLPGMLDGSFPVGAPAIRNGRSASARGDVTSGTP